MNPRDKIIVKKLLKYTHQVAETIEIMDLDYEKFKNDFIARNAISMCILQISELANKLTQEFKTSYSTIPWRAIISMRNRMAHDYDESDIEMIWNTAIEDIVNLSNYCRSILGDISSE